MRLLRLIWVTALALVLLLVATHNAHSNENDMIALTGCVQGFAQGGYFFSDVVNDKGKVKFQTTDNRTLKTSDVFGVDTVEVVQPACQAPQVEQR